MPSPVTGGSSTGGDASAANQTTQITAEQAILAKLSADPATQTTLAAVLAKIIAAPATEAAQILINAVLGVPTGTAIVTDADGTLQRYLRGLVKLLGVDGALVKQGGGALTDRSGTVTAGGTSQQVAAALATRKCFFYQNTSNETQYLNFGAAASAANSIEIASKGYWENPPNFCPTGTINMLGATTAKTFTAKEG